MDAGGEGVEDIPVPDEPGGRRSGPVELPENTLTESTLKTWGFPSEDGLAVIASSCRPALRPLARN